MRGRTTTAVLAVAALAGLSLTRLALARAAVREPLPSAVVTDDVTVLVPIRSGDPLLPERLAASVATLAPARVSLLVDHDDDAGAAAAHAAAAGERALGRDHVSVESYPPPPPGLNPKVVKLAAAQPGNARVICLLDDDTVLPPGGLSRLLGGLGGGGASAGVPGGLMPGGLMPSGLLPGGFVPGGLVTGLPVYLDSGGMYSRLVAAFVNSSAVVTYLPLARVGPSPSVNGMVLAMRRTDLELVGGFAAITGATCDDYALARAFRRAGLPVVQLAQPALLTTTVPGPCAYLALMRRWMLFAEQVVRHDPSPRLLALVVAPPALSIATLVIAARAGLGPLAGAVGVLVAGAAGTRAVRREMLSRWGGDGGDGRGGSGGDDGNLDLGAEQRPGGLLLEVLALLLAPFHLATAALGPRTVRWRGRTVRVGIGENGIGENGAGEPIR